MSTKESKKEDKKAIKWDKKLKELKAPLLTLNLNKRSEGELVNAVDVVNAEGIYLKIQFDNNNNNDNDVLFKLKQTAAFYKKAVMDQDQKITELSHKFDAKNKTITEQNKTITEQNKQITEQNKQITEQNKKITEQNQEIMDQNSEIQRLLKENENEKIKMKKKVVQFITEQEKCLQTFIAEQQKTLKTFLDDL